MSITVTTNAKDVSRDLLRIFEDQIPFATANAINATALDLQKTQRAHQRRVFTVRREEWVDRAVKMKRWARKHRLEAHVGIAAPGGRRRSEILAKFEDQNVKRPLKAEALWVPTDEVLVDGIVMDGWRPKQMGFKLRGSGPKARVLVGTTKKAVMIRYHSGQRAPSLGGQTGLIFERDGENLNLLFHRQPEVGINPELNFHANAQRTVRDRFEPNFAVAFNRAIMGAR